MTISALDVDWICWNSDRFMMESCRLDEKSSSLHVFGYLFVCAELERGIQRAEGDHCGEQKDCAENDEHSADNSRDNSAKV
jgi:hypothetical protein